EAKPLERRELAARPLGHRLRPAMRAGEVAGARHFPVRAQRRAVVAVAARLEGGEGADHAREPRVPFPTPPRRSAPARLAPLAPRARSARRAWTLRMPAHRWRTIPPPRGPRRGPAPR